ncbi:hypothetical protein [Agromyces soli]|uniref:AbiEi antitoxin C-terminal domain-containing protein n=1 Tax=Agromyces soli TaxID=659012 RepID=A0ABY4ARA9_9MICO|nr:hypothetical protein [Agromyces soli]UOE25334.1 hypothetical protein MTP13_13440 [Agromyces soli]
MPRLPDVLDTTEFSLAELCAARIDGELVPVVDRWVAIDAPDVPAVRARALGGAPGGPAIAGWSAAWVHGATPVPPVVAEFCVPHGARVARSRDPRRLVREVAITAADHTMVGGCRCTSLERTAFDLLRDPRYDDRRLAPVLAELVRSDPELPARLRARFAPERRVPHRRLALIRLSGLPY